MNEECTILVTSCDAYRDVEGPFLKLFRRYWPDCPFSLTVNGETAVEPGFDREILSGRGKTWSQMLVEALDAIDTPYVLLLMNDYYLCGRVDTNLILRRLSEVRSSDALSYRLVPEPPMAIKNTAYSVSCKATIWNREFLRELASKTNSAWEFERRGSFMFDESDHRPIFVSSVREFPFLDVIHKGYWEPYGVELLRREGLEYDFSRRGRAPCHLRVREWLKGKIFHLAPDLITRLQNKL